MYDSKNSILYYDFSEHENKIVMPKYSNTHMDGTTKRKSTFTDRNAISIIKRSGGLANLQIPENNK